MDIKPTRKTGSLVSTSLLLRRSAVPRLFPPGCYYLLGMANFGELVLVLGDAHVPDRASKIAEGFQRMLVPNKMQHVICTGDCDGIMDQLQGLAPNMHVVAGINGGANSTMPESRVLQVGAFKIGVVHGHQILPWKNEAAVDRWRRKLGVDVLISGHSHQNQFRIIEDRFVSINPVRLSSISGPFLSNRLSGWKSSDIT